MHIEKIVVGEELWLTRDVYVPGLIHSWILRYKHTQSSKAKQYLTMKQWIVDVVYVLFMIWCLFPDFQVVVVRPEGSSVSPSRCLWVQSLTVPTIQVCTAESCNYSVQIKKYLFIAEYIFYVKIWSDSVGHLKAFW